MGKILAWVAKAIVTALGTLFSSWKIFLGTTLCTIGFVFFYNMIVDLFQEICDFGVASISDVSVSGSGTTYQMVGLAGYIGTQLRIPECVAFIVSIILAKWLLRKIPFIKW